MSEFNNYFNGQFIESTDLNFDNVSHRDELAERFNILIDSPGVVKGYNDSLDIIPGAVANSITILSGVAFDINGRLIEILDTDTNRINIIFDNIVGETYYVKAKYKQLLLEPQFDPITGVGPDPNNPEIPYFTKIQDYYDIEISTLVSDIDQVEIGRVIGSGAGNLLTATLIDLNQRKLATIKNDLLVNIDHTTLKNIGVNTHPQIDQKLSQLFADTGIIPTVDGSPSLDIPLSDLIIGFYDHDHSGDGRGARIDHNSLKNVHPDQHHKKIHIHSLDPGAANPDSDDAYVIKINLSDDSIDPIEVRGKLSGDYIKDGTVTNTNISPTADIDQNKVAKSAIVENNFAGVPINLQQELNQLRSELKYAKFGHSPLQNFNDAQTPNIQSLDSTVTSAFNGTTGHKHTGVNGDGPKLDDNSIRPASLTKASIATGTIDNSLISNTAAIDESKLNLEDSYAWRNYAITGAAKYGFQAGTLILAQPLVIYNLCCDRQVNAVTPAPLSLNPGDTIYVDWPESHDDSQDLPIQSSNGIAVNITSTTIVLGYVNENDHHLYVNWAHNPDHRHTGAPGDYEQIDINASTTGQLPVSRVNGAASAQSITDQIALHNTDSMAHSDIRADLSDKLSRKGDFLDPASLSGNGLTFPNNTNLTFKNQTGSQQPISFYRPNSSPVSKAKLHLSLGDSTSSLNELHIGRGTFSTGNVILGVDSGSGLGKISSDGTITAAGVVEGNTLKSDTGDIFGSNKKMIGITNTQVILNPFNDFTDGTKVTNNLIIEGITPDTGLLQIENQFIEKDQNYGGIAFSTEISNVQSPAKLYSKDIFLTNLNDINNQPVGAWVSDVVNNLQQVANFFKKENFTYGTSPFIASNTVPLLHTPTQDSMNVHVKISGIMSFLIEGTDYTVSGNNLVISPSIVFSTGDMAYTQYTYSN